MQSAPSQDAPAHAPTVLGASLTLPCGVSVPNRMLKSAMSEIQGTVGHAPTEGLVRIYQTWAEGGIGLSITGNVMVDRRALGEPRNVVIEDDRDLVALQAWAEAGKVNGGQIWMQINHPGKQSPAVLTPEPVSPSAIPLGNGLERAFATPRALTEAEILDLIERFGRTAGVAQQAGFSGVQIHGAHGYLISQFLSPHHNQRTDRWGGSLENRMRFLMGVYGAMRAAVGPAFPVGIKINSADFQRGGFTEEESMEVIEALVAAGIDLVEISGGTYEAPAMTGASGAHKRASTLQREAYFLTFAESLRARVKVPIAVTGGFRTAQGMADAVASGAVDMVGLGRALALEPDLPKRVLEGEAVVSKVRPLSTGIKGLDRIAMLDVTYYENQIGLMALGKAPNPNMGAWRSLVASFWRLGTQAFQLRRARRK